jgi:spermidine/putrescine-binding protein
VLMTFQTVSQYHMPLVLWASLIAKTNCPTSSQAGNFFDRLAQRGAFAMLTDRRSMIGGALLHSRFDWNSQNSKALQQAQSLLVDAKKRSRDLLSSPDIVAELAKGAINYVITYNGDAILAAQDNKNIAFAVPIEGSGMYEDKFAIPTASGNPVLAHQFLNLTANQLLIDNQTS